MPKTAGRRLGAPHRDAETLVAHDHRPFWVTGAGDVSEGIAEAVAKSATKHHRVVLDGVSSLLDVAEDAIRQGQPGEPWSSFAIAVTEALVALTSRLDT